MLKRGVGSIRAGMPDIGLLAVSLALSHSINLQFFKFEAAHSMGEWEDAVGSLESCTGPTTRLIGIGIKPKISLTAFGIEKIPEVLKDELDVIMRSSPNTEIGYAKEAKCQSVTIFNQ